MMTVASAQKKVQLTGVITPYQLHFYDTMGLSQQRLWQPSLIDKNPVLTAEFSLFIALPTVNYLV